MTDRTHPDAPAPAGRRPPTAHRWAAAGLAVALVLAAGACSGDEGASAPTTTGTTAAPPPPSTTEAPLDAGERRYVYEPEVGDCFDRRVTDQDGEAEVGERIVLLLDCELPHQFEVYAVLEIDDAALPPPTTVTTTTAPPPPAPTTTLDPEGNPVGSVDPTDGSEDGADGATTTVPPTTVAPSPRWPGQDVLERFARQVCPQPFDAWVGVPYEVSTLEIAWVLPEESAWVSGERTMGCTVYDPTAERMVGTQAGAGR